MFSSSKLKTKKKGFQRSVGKVVDWKEREVLEFVGVMREQWHG